MTAEVVTMNKGAAAMAADSAITLLGQKVYNSGSKLFPLSKNHPIGVMFYGNASLMGVPWETIVAEYRQKVSNHHFDKIEQFGAHFLKFISESELLFPEELQKKYLLEVTRWKFGYMVEAINQRVASVLKAKGSVSQEEVKQIVAEVIIAEIDPLNSQELVSGASLEDIHALSESLRPEFEKIVEEVFKNLPLEDGIRNALLTFGPNVSLREWLFTARKSGLVICGFGAKEIYPSIFSVELEAICKGKVKCFKPEIQSISDSISAYIRPFAQQDVALSFLNGIDPSFHQILNDYIGTLFEGLPDLILQRLPLEDDVKDLLRHTLSDLGNQSAESFKQHLHKVTRDRFINPVISAVQALPKDELATMAETLVSLTSFRRRMSLDMETVGGPVDVAVISKKDGFIWIKRKHYFSPELNPHFFESVRSVQERRN